MCSSDLADLDDVPRVYLDDTLRHTAYVMADEHCARCAVVTRGDEIVIGSIELADLLVGRRRDLHEMSHAERVIRVKLPARRAPLRR